MHHHHHHMNVKKFPEGFLWGVATASYQIEGSPLADGAGMSIWHTFSHTPGNVKNGDTGDVACDHYNRWKEDIEIIEKLGVKAYRFSISWPRILPEGTGRVNQKGLDFYNRIIDTLLEKGITPFVTIFHWDLPFALQLKGGLLNREIADWFAEYSRVLFENFGDRVKNWITFNEPLCSAIPGYGSGTFAPGRQSTSEPWTVGHNILVAHGRAVKVFRETVKDGKIGIVLNGDFTYPWDAADPADKEAAERRLEFFTAWFADPIYLGDYPASMRKQLGDRLPTFTPEERALVHGSNDFYGMNHYTSNYIRHRSSPASADDTVGNVDVLFTNKQGNCIGPETAMPWLRPCAAGFRDFLVWISKRYGYPPIYVTENGAAFDDVVSEDGRVHDQNRIDYLKAYIGAMVTAVELDGVNVKGYFVWSLLDNFEWAEGYSKRFGIVYVDYSTQKRIVKDSGYWYSNVVKNNGLED
uniref:Beta-glucosidase Chimeric protein n=1 Tax=Hypocrea jecorina TaxID=51453 RepID=UPI0002AA2D51|nr:Chain A, Beta-glucosidase Chimeric protein [Thermotoga maritima MSB8]4GXP_B Chain B, Beta-glucosidase Chimeric protein [Thermotoga maritima MSB8]4GXP_C Chain C, Beta-glucosidase Chimeric protein [Thermotoga maritima MSB8]